MYGLPTTPLFCYAGHMAISDRQLLHSLSRMPFVDSAELAGILGEPHSTVHRGLTNLLANGIVGRVSHGTAHLPSSQRYYLTARGISEATELLGYGTTSDFVRAYPVSREWLALLIRRMDAVAAVYRLAASLSPGIDGLRSHVEFHRRGRFDATITLHDGRSFGMVRQSLALRRRSLYDRLRAIAEYDYTRRPDTILVLTPSVWEQRLTTRFCMELNLEGSYVGEESRDVLERRDSHVWQKTSGLFSGSYYNLGFVSSQGGTGGALHTESPERKRASIPHPERMVRAAATFGISPSEKRTLDLVTDHPMIPREHPSPRGSHSPPESLHELLLVHRTRGRPAPVPHHPVRRGHRGGRGYLRAHIGPDDPDVAAHPCVLPARSVHNRDTGTLLASSLGAGIPTTGAVRTERLPVGLALSPDASCPVGGR